MQSFLDDCIERRPGEKMERTRLYEMYKNYCFKNEWGELSSRGFYKNLRGKGFRDYKSDGYLYFKDICPFRADTGKERANVSEFVPVKDNEKVPF